MFLSYKVECNRCGKTQSRLRPNKIVVCQECKIKRANEIKKAKKENTKEA